MSLRIDIQPGTRTPIYRQIVDRVRLAASTGEAEVGEPPAQRAGPGRTAPDQPQHRFPADRDFLREKILIIFLMPVLGRWVYVWIACISSPVPGGKGLGCATIENTSGITFFYASILPTVVCLYALHSTQGHWGFGIVLMLTLAFITYVIALRFSDRIGGMTEHTLGAMLEISEMLVPLVYLTVTGMWRAYLFI